VTKLNTSLEERRAALIWNRGAATYESEAAARETDPVRAQAHRELAEVFAGNAAHLEAFDTPEGQAKRQRQRDARARDWRRLRAEQQRSRAR
jgi:hypothetical protein